jgi:GT2 family glycosyltransferase
MEQPKPGRVGIVIVNWNSGPLLGDCLESMSTCDQADRIAQVVVVDNDSHDGSCDDLPDTSVPIRVIRNDTNRGFAAACNQGAAECRAEYLLFLNPDSELLENSLRGPLEYMADPRNRDVGICGIQLLDERGRVARSCSRLPTCYSLVTMALRMHGLSRRLFPPHFMKEWDHSETQVVDQVIGAFFFVRSGLFEQLGGFDERFFVYFEEVDFCQRSRTLGFKTVFLASAQARHVGGGCSNQIRGRALFYSLRSRIAYAEKHFARWQSNLVLAATLLAEPVIRIGVALLRLKWKNIGPLMQAFGSLWRSRFHSDAPASQPRDEVRAPHFASTGVRQPHQ